MPKWQNSHSSFIDPSLECDKLTKEDLKKTIALQSFFEKHCHSSHYVFQIKKCTDESCYYCAEHPIRLPVEVFRELSFLPLPLLDHTKEHYQKFADIFGQIPDEKGRPSYVPTPSEDARQIDREHKGITGLSSLTHCACDTRNWLLSHAHTQTR